MSITYPLDHSGVVPSNLITNELHSVNEAHFKDYFFLVPNFAPFYTNNFKAELHVGGVVTPLVEDVHFSFALPYVTGTRVTGKAMYGAVTLHNLDMSGLISIEYQTLGGDQIPDRLQLLTELSDKAYNPRTTIWDVLTNVPNALPPTPHYQDYDSFYGQEELVNMLGEIRDAILTNSSLTRDQLIDFLAALDSGQFDNYVNKNGDTMLGALSLEGVPTDNLHAVPKKYVDLNFISREQLIAELSLHITLEKATTELAKKVSKIGDTLSGPLVLHADPVEPSQASTKNYVDLLRQHLANELSRLDQDINDLNNDRVTKAYVDNKFNELKAYIDTIASFRI